MLFQNLKINIALFLLQKKRNPHPYDDPPREARRNPRHPEVGRARAPDLTKVKPRTNTKNSNYRRPNQASKVKVFDDKNYRKAANVSYMQIIYNPQSPSNVNIVSHVCVCLVYIPSKFWFFKNIFRKLKKMSMKAEKVVPVMTTMIMKDQDLCTCRRLTTTFVVKADRADMDTINK